MLEICLSVGNTIVDRSDSIVIMLQDIAVIPSNMEKQTLHR